MKFPEEPLANPKKRLVNEWHTFWETTSEAKCPEKPLSGVAKLFYLND